MICEAVGDFIEHLDLTGNKITVLPLRWQLQAPHVHFVLDGNPMRSPPLTVVEDSRPGSMQKKCLINWNWAI